MPSTETESPALDAAAAADVGRLARCALQVIATPYPHKLDHVIQHAGDLRLPAEQHPVFHGSYDWHSSVHMHWSLLRLRRLAPGSPEAAAIERHLDAAFTAARLDGELAYVRQPGRATFERPYGWAWLLMLQAEALRHAEAGDTAAARWAEALHPLARELASRLAGYLERIDYPIRVGTHASTAFAMILARAHAEAAGDRALLDVIEARARHWFGNDRRYPAHYEPSGSDFLSAGLCEALLMARVLGAAFAAWWSAFRPEDLSAWLEPARVADRGDAQIVHLDGLNLSRAWCLRGIADGAGSDRAALLESAGRHRDAALPHVTGGDFVATHWLISFSLLC